MKLQGKVVILTMAAVALGLAGFSVWFRRQTTHRALQFWGTEQAAVIQGAGRVLLSRLTPAAEQEAQGADTGQATVLVQGRQYRVSPPEEIQTLPGVLHLQSYLIEDRSFIWNRSTATNGSMDRPHWSRLLTFADSQHTVQVALTDDAGQLYNFQAAAALSIQPLSPFLQDVLGRADAAESAR